MSETEQGVPRPDVRKTLSLALLLGVSVAVATVSVLAIASIVLLAAVAPTARAGGASKIPPLPPGLVALVVVQGVVSLVGAIAALLGRGWGRFVVAATGGLGIVAVGLRGVSDASSVVAVPLHVACLFLLVPAVSRWTTEEGRAEARAFATRAYVSSVLWVLLVFGWLLATTPIKATFDDMAIDLPWVTEQTLGAGMFLHDFGVFLPLAPPLIVLGLFPVLWVPTGLRQRATIGINVGGALVLAAMVGSVVLAIVKLRAALGQ